MILVPNEVKKTRTIYFFVFSSFSFVLLTAAYCLFQHFIGQWLVNYKTEYLKAQTYNMSYFMRATISDKTLSDEEQRLRMDDVAKQFSASVRFISQDNEAIRLDSLPYQISINPYQVQVPLIIDGDLKGHLFAYYDLTKDDFIPAYPMINREFKRLVNISFFCMLLFSLIVSAIIAGQMSKPLRVVNDLIVRKMNGDSQVALPQIGSIELNRMIHTINMLTERLYQQETWRKELMQDVTHELRTPLTSVMSRLEAMIDGLYPLTANNINHILSEIERLSRLVSDVEKLSEAEGARFQLNIRHTDMEQLMRNIFESFLFLAQEKGINFVLNSGYVPCQVEIDPDRMIQIVSNLVSNSIKYTSLGGTIEIGLQADSDEASVYCSDTGTGIPPEDIPYIFNRFYRVDKSRSRESGGIGVGLSIARALVEAHGGSIEVESSFGAGTRFRVRIPVSFECKERFEDRTILA